MSEFSRSAIAETETTTNPRIRAFCEPGGPEIFHAVAHRNEIWRPDPFDVETIHEEARDVFRGLVARAGMTPTPDSGRILLLMGESGAGKTHLMRVFRNWTHAEHRGYCGYMQMTSATDDYGRYVLNNLIDSLSQPYYEPAVRTTGLMLLSTALAESSRSIPTERLTQLREDELEPHCLARMIEALADQIVIDDRFNTFDLDLVRALLYLQRDDPSLRSRVLKYLRCEDLSKSDREALGGLIPRTYADAPARVVELLGRLVGSVESIPLILCLDQLEDIDNLDDSSIRFRRAMSTVCDLADRVPSSVVVISCLEDFYVRHKERLSTPAKARIEHDPKPLRLSASREVSEVSEMISKRLAALYESRDAEVVDDDPTFPIPRRQLDQLANLPARNVLDWCRDFRERCIETGAIVDSGETVSPPPPPPPPIRLEQLWNDARSRPAAVPIDEGELAILLAEAIAGCASEEDEARTYAAEADGTMIQIRKSVGDQQVDSRLVGICNKAAQGGGLGKQVAEVERLAGAAAPALIPVIVRSSDFPTSPNSAISRQLGKLIAGGGRRVVVEDSDWRVMATMRGFRKQHQADSDFTAWLIREQPLSRLKSLREILGLDDPSVTPPPALEPVQPLSLPPEPGEGPGWIIAGITTGLRPYPVEIDPQLLTMHAAFLGAPGSGKTTLALALIEQLMLRGVPAILIDRKGDLCRYADPNAWNVNAPDEESEARRLKMRSIVDVSLFTPGNPNGRPLSIAAIPHGLGSLPSFERTQLARYAAGALGGMMNYKANGTEQTRLVILSSAMDLLSQSRPDGSVSLQELVHFIDDADPALVNAIGKLDTKHFAKLVEELETLRLSRGELLAAHGEPLDAEALFGMGSHAVPGKTRLSVISTKFLGNDANVQFWVAQFLMEMARWTSRSPSKTLQAVLLFDEADVYLPATRQPPTKAPMENLLKRSRSAGLGLFLATQSPGDFDYKCRENIRSWFVGRVKETTALAKMKPMFSDCRVDVESKLPGQSAGEFHLLSEGQALAFRAARSAIPTEQVPEEEILELARRGE
jgi:GTPase SAR1 family protein